MTDDFERDFEREKRAFADGLRESAEGESFRPLAADQVKGTRPSPRVAAWGKGIAAAAAAAVVIGGVAFGLSQLGGSATSASLPAEPATQAASGAVPEADAQGSDAGAGIPSAAAQVESASLDWQTASVWPLEPRSYASGAWVDGKFYLVGGQLDQPCPPNADCIAPSKLLRDGASYDPATDTWTRIADAPVAISQGRPVVVGARLYFQLGYGADAKVYAYQPATDSWTRIAVPNGQGTLVAAEDQLVSISFSDEESSGYDELYDAASDRWSRLPDDPLGKSYNRYALWVNGKLLLGAHKLVANPGSEEPSFVRLAELDLNTMKWRKLPDVEVLSGFSQAIGDLVVFPETGSADGGEVNNWGRSYPMGGIYNVVSGEWFDLPPLDGGDGVRQAWSDTSVVGDRVLASGHLLDPATRTWTLLPAPPSGNRDGQTVITSPDGILVVGGWTGSAHTEATSYLPVR